MLETLTEKLDDVFKKLGNRGRLSEKDIDEALRQFKLALLGADVNFKVVKQLLSKVRIRALDAEGLRSLTAVQQITKIVYEEMVEILGHKRNALHETGTQLSTIMLVGLQGSGKTTTSAKLAYHLKNQGETLLLVAADTRRPAARKQLESLAKSADLGIYNEETEDNPLLICKHGLQEATRIGANRMIVDTQGRLHLDEPLMVELEEMKRIINPSEVLLVVDAMTGQDAVRVAQEFHSQVGITGIILTKMDGDARGGAALSVRYVTGVPIKFLGVGEKIKYLEPFYPERLASRILNMGDIASLIERAEQVVEPKAVQKLKNKSDFSKLDLEDLLEQMRQLNKMGSLKQLVGMVPGFSSFASNLSEEDSEKRIQKMEAIILSMTPEERRNPDILNGSRRNRISRGSGTTAQDINQLLKQFQQIKKLSKMVAKGKGSRGLGGMFGIPGRRF